MMNAFRCRLREGLSDARRFCLLVFGKLPLFRRTSMEVTFQSKLSQSSWDSDGLTCPEPSESRFQSICRSITADLQ